MNSEILLTILTVLVAVDIAFDAWRVWNQAIIEQWYKQLLARLETVHQLVNSQQAALMTATQELAHARGVSDEKERAKKDVAP